MKTHETWQIGKNVKLGKDVTIWNFVVIGDDTKIGDGTKIGSHCDIGKNVHIGKNCIIQSSVCLSNYTFIGDNVFIAPNVNVLNDLYPNSDCLTPCYIEDDVILGGSVTVLPDISMGERSVATAGSLVTRDVQADWVVMGRPAEPIMTREEYEEKKRLSTKRNWLCKH